MADISDDSSFGLGLANIAAQNSGPSAVANQANTAADTARLQAGTEGQHIQNAAARLQYQLFQQSMAHLTDFRGQGGPSLGSAADDASGVSATSALPAAGAKSGVVTPEMDVGASASDQAKIESSLEQIYNINPMGTPQEQSAILQAHQYAAQMKLSGNKGLADAADQRLAMLKEQRDMAVADRKNAAQVDANGHYDKLSAVNTAPDGRAWSTLVAIAPDSAKQIKLQHPDATPDELEDIARDTTGHVSAFMHRFTNRPVKVGDDGATYDEQTGQKVDVPIRGVSPEKQVALLELANKPVPTKNSDGRDVTKPQYKKDNYKNPNQWVTDAVAQIRARNGANSAVQAVGNRAARVPPQPGQPPQPGAPQPGAPQPGAPQPGAPQPGAPQPGAMPQRPGQQPDNGLLPGINPDALPKFQAPAVQQDVGQTPGEKITQEEMARESIAQQKDANKNYINAQKNDALIRAAQREAATLANNPRMAGPGSELTQALAKIKTFVSGKPPDSLVDLGTLNKVLLQMGAQNVRQALEGQKITQAEFMKLLSEGNPNTEQPLATVNKLLSYSAAQNDYDMRFQRTKQIALSRGASPITVDGDIGSRADRGDYVEGRVGVRPPGSSVSPAAPGGVPTITSQAQYDALPKGASYVDANGKPHKKGGQ